MFREAGNGGLGGKQGCIERLHFGEAIEKEDGTGMGRRWEQEQSIEKAEELDTEGRELRGSVHERPADCGKEPGRRKRMRGNDT